MSHWVGKSKKLVKRATHFEVILLIPLVQYSNNVDAITNVINQRQLHKSNYRKYVVVVISHVSLCNM